MQFVSVCVCVSVCVGPSQKTFAVDRDVKHPFRRLCVCVFFCLSVCQWTNFQSNGCTDMDAVFDKCLLIALARTQWKLVNLGQKSRSQWRNIPFFFINHCLIPYCVSQLSYVWSKWNLICRLDNISVVVLCWNFISDEWMMTSLWHNNFPYQKFYGTFKLHTWYQCTTT